MLSSFYALTSALLCLFFVFILCIYSLYFFLCFFFMFLLCVSFLLFSIPSLIPARLIL
ncbi:hypothetical protein HMPREF6123_2077 [Oribacterium sinus F0268]|uniref:Uncharacterized protein n=1 Tax=Oribacterium sinus F0268 TaxID=585501 RepID=C2L008_9FIRM|nr:hypothetical protein HMPREF6123_2077 [Oribacterium sinus F0268]